MNIIRFRSCFAVLAIVSCTGLLYQSSYLTVNPFQSRGIRITKLFQNMTSTIESRQPKMAMGPSDWILTSYMRSGSSFTGQLLGHRPDTFYWFEPLSAFHRHFWSGDKVCYDQYDRGKCRKPTNGETTQYALSIVQKILNCSFSTLGKLRNAYTTRMFSGIHWKDYEQCRHTNPTPARCLLQMNTACMGAKHRGMKLLRLTVDNTAVLLDSNPKLKVVHLFRDPRAIINSRLTTKWYDFGVKTTMNSLLPVVNDARHLCNRMLHEARAAELMRRKYPDRFAVVLYEDLLSDLNVQKTYLFDFLGIANNSEGDHIQIKDIDAKTHTVHRMGADFKTWWRRRLKLSTIRLIDWTCRDVHRVLGYMPIANESMLRNLSISTNQFNQDLSLRQISSGAPYDSVKDNL